MQQRDVNARQLEVLRWIADGCPDGVMEDFSYKTTAVALRTRGLANVSKRGGWHASITEAGSYYLEHGCYPGVPPKMPRTRRPAAPKPEIAKPLVETEAPQAPVPTEPVAEKTHCPPPKRHVAVPKSLRRPHHVVQELRDGKAHLPISKNAQSRALRIIQAVAVAAEAEGWRVQSVAKSRTHWGNAWDSKDLFVINTGESQVGVRLIQEKDRSPHVPTAYELKQKERYSYTRIPEYDYAPSKRLKIELNGWGARGRTCKWADRQRWSLDDKLGQLIDEVMLRHEEAIQERLEKEAAEAERQRMYEIAVDEAKILCREHHRGEVFVGQVNAWLRAQSMRNYLAAMEVRIEGPDGEESTAALEWLAWAKAFVEKSDPLDGGIRMPDDPEMTVEAINDFLPAWARRHSRTW